MGRKREFKQGDCQSCGERFLKKPARKTFCTKRCAYQFHNKKRGRVTLDLAVEYLSQHLITIPEAVALGYGKETTLRSKIRRGEVRGVRLFGRVLVEKREKGREGEL